MKYPYGNSRSISCILYLCILYLFDKPKFEVLFDMDSIPQSLQKVKGERHFERKSENGFARVSFPLFLNLKDQSFNPSKIFDVI